ncbi:MAG: hypothetical protein FJZ90_02275 [Chloroflexi bacterium]|nr:hypothetical protein [Chloroflexota bacterium]
MRFSLFHFNDLAGALNGQAAIGAMLDICKDIADNSGGDLVVAPTEWQLALPGQEPVTVDIDAADEWNPQEEVSISVEEATGLAVDWLAKLAGSLSGKLVYHDTDWDLVLPDAPAGAEADKEA